MYLIVSLSKEKDAFRYKGGDNSIYDILKCAILIPLHALKKFICILLIKTDMKFSAHDACLWSVIHQFKFSYK